MPTISTSSKSVVREPVRSANSAVLCRVTTRYVPSWTTSSTGGAGGLVDPTRIVVKDLTLSYNDPLLAKVRSTLRQQLGYSRNPKRRYAMDCVFSTEQPIYPVGDGTISHQKPDMDERTTLDCATGIGSFVGVTACFGFTAAAHAIRKYVKVSR